ncbi:MAG: hypothetical protein V4615_15800, partial [Bacteroidota bacterium]
TNMRTIIITLLLLAATSAVVAQENSLKVSAFLVYDDGSISTFDVLNDKSVVLWNGINASEPDGQKQSNKVKVVLAGQMKGIKLSIKNGDLKFFEKDNLTVFGTKTFIIDDTGCAEVFVTVTADNKTICQGTIPFHCGE